MVSFLHYNTYKMEYNPLFDRFWTSEGNTFGSPDKLDDYMKEDNFEIEVFESLRGDYKTTVTCKFNSNGYLVSHQVDCVNISEDTEIMAEMKDKLLDAIYNDDFEEASKYQDKINRLRELTELKGKPTL